MERLTPHINSGSFNALFSPQSSGQQELKEFPNHKGLDFFHLLFPQWDVRLVFRTVQGQTGAITTMYVVLPSYEAF